MTDPLITQLDRVIVAIHSADDCAPYPGGKPWLTDDWRRYERMARAAIEAARGCDAPIECGHEAALGEAEEKVRQLQAAIADIDAHATPVGLLKPDDPEGSPHHYLLTVGALHRALGKAYTAEPCDHERERLRAENAELRELYELQRTRMQEAVSLWRSEAPEERALVLPDLGELLAWLMKRRADYREDR